jgi:predicted DNA-binding transcriptional regulator AlpA
LRTVEAVEPVGIVEIAQRLGVTRAALDKWRSRDVGFPEPRWTVGGRPAWEWDDIEAWARKTGRLPTQDGG